MHLKLSISIICLFLFSNLPAQCWQQAAGGAFHTIALKNDGTLWAWGGNASGQLGDGTTTEQLTPIQVDTATDWQTVGAGTFYSVALKTDGTLWSWGSNENGQLGTGGPSSTLTLYPTQIGTDNDWREIAVGEYHIVAIKTDGTLWAWGDNYYGELGNGTYMNINVPIQIGADTDWQHVSAGGFHTLAIKTNGTLWAWGYNFNGQLGNGTNGPSADQITPVQAGTDNDWRQVEGGYLSSEAIKNDGTLWAWGANHSGQLGDGTTTPRNIPGQVGNTSDWQQVVEGSAHVVAVKTDGTLWTWGHNADGQLGDGTYTSKKVPTKIGTADTWQRVGAGPMHSLAIKSDSTLWAWGNGYAGQLGDGLDMAQVVPVEVDCGLSSTKPDLLAAEELRIFPNVAQDHLTVLVTGMNATGWRFEVLNMLGETVIAQQALANDGRVEIDGLAPGMYILTVGNKEYQISKQFVKL